MASVSFLEGLSAAFVAGWREVPEHVPENVPERTQTDSLVKKKRLGYDRTIRVVLIAKGCFIVDPQAHHHGLVLGALALERGLVSREQLAEAMERWLADPTTSPAQVLVDRGYLSKADQQRLEVAVAQGGPLPRNVSSLEGCNTEVGEKTHRSVRSVASQTIGMEGRAPYNDPGRTIGQTVRELDSPAGRRMTGIALSELNDSHQRFKLLRPHAKGGLGIVSVAHDVELDREVAIKEMRLEGFSDDAVQRFMMEARVTGQLDHPGIPPVYALGYFEDGRPFYVMRLIEGVTLKQAVEDFHKRYPPPNSSRQRHLELRKLLGAFVSVCNTLRYAHSRHVLHRDIKPSNIMLGNFGETLVLDWGLAKYREESLPYSELETKAHQSKRRNDDPTLTGTGSVLGTPHYMSPEQARGQWESVNLRSEVYSLGATLYTILTGKLPFSGTTREAVLEQVRQGNCRRPRDVDPRIPAELDAICVKAMALQREDRFASAGELASEIEHWLADEPISSYREGSVRRLQRWLKTHQTALGMLVALVTTGMVAVMLGAFAVSFEHRRANESWQRAENESRRAETNAEAARHFVARFMAINNSSKLAEIPGSEKPRLELLNEVIAQLNAWALENPGELHRKVDAVEALRERSLLFSAMNDLDKAWSDLSLALDVLEDMTIAPDTPLHERMVLTRLYALNELAKLVEKRNGPRATLNVLLPAQRQAEQHLQQDSDDVGRRVALCDLNVNLARQLHRLGRTTEAAELVDAAATQFEAMLATADSQALAYGLHNASEMLQRLTCEARSLQAMIALALEDYAFAQVCLERSEQICDDLRETAPSAMYLLDIKLECLDLRTQLSLARERPEQALRTVRQTADRAAQLASLFPHHGEVVLAAAKAKLRHARQELKVGSLSNSTSANAYALEALESLCGQADAKPQWLLELARAHRIRADIALTQGDSDTAVAHCHQAQASLIAAARQSPGLKGIAEEAGLIQIARSQAEMLH